MPDLTLRRFHNALRILMNIDVDQFVAAGGSIVEWTDFRDNPHLYFVRASDAVAEALWRIAEARQPVVAPDFLYCARDWDCTYEWADRSLAAENRDVEDDPVEFATLRQGAPKWAVRVVTAWLDGDPEGWEIQWFDSEAEALAARDKAKEAPADA